MSLWRKPGTRTFQLVHRSQRDPLINDPEASDRVLKEIDTKQKKASTVVSTSDILGQEAAGPADKATDGGDAAAYGIYFNDDEYNYMQHLRAVGDASDSYLIEAPSRQKVKGRAGLAVDEADSGGIVVREPIAVHLPEDSLPSHPLDELSYTEATTSRVEVAGLQPDLDPAIREVLEALDDEAYALEDDLGSEDEDDFFNSIVHGAEAAEHDYSKVRDGEANSLASAVDSLSIGNDEATGGNSLEARVARFKATNAEAYLSDDEADILSEDADTIAELRASSSRRPPRKSPSAAGSQFSMSSSAMFRNQGLQTLDERFDQIEKLYDDDSDDESWGERSETDLPESSFSPGQPREDLDSILEDFLSRYEVLGGKMRQVLEPSEGSEGNTGKLDRLRKELSNFTLADGEVDSEMEAKRLEKARILAAVERQWREESGSRHKIRLNIDEGEKDRWDCETVLSTYSNVSNHPRLLRARDELTSTRSRIRLDRKTGMPSVEATMPLLVEDECEKEDELSEEEDGDQNPRPETVKRPRGESAEEKRARKASVKQQRSARRTEKKSTKEAFGTETKRQKRVAGRALADGAAADVRPGEGVRRLA